MKWEVRTTDGTLVFRGYDSDGLEEDVAKSSADERNHRAEKLGITTRYEAVRRVAA